MRFAMLLLFLLSPLAGAHADVSARIHSERPFGYFVGDLIHAWVDIEASADAALQTASLPEPGPLTISLDLRDVRLETLEPGDGKRWRLHLTYQNFYVSLDVRDIKIPGFTLVVTRPVGDETMQIPAWSVGVAPLREVTPTKAEEATEYMRPDGDPPLLGEGEPKRRTYALAAGALALLLAVARDRAWPPFHRRRTRRFARLARSLSASARRPHDVEQLGAATRSVHRAIDEAAGHAILGQDLDALFLAHPEFAPLRARLRQFFEASERLFYDGAGDRDYGIAQLASLVRALAERERAQ